MALDPIPEDHPPFVQEELTWVPMPWWRRHQGYLVLIIVLIFAVPLTIYNNHRQEQRIKTAVAKSTDKQNDKFHLEEQKAARLVTDALAKKQHTDEIITWKRSLGACERNNILRARIQDATTGLGVLELALSNSRAAAAALEKTKPLADHDLDQARKYLKLKSNLKQTPQINCAARYPNPFPPKGHQ